MRVFWDTNVFIYLMEPYGSLSEAAGNLRTRMLRRGDTLYTSAVSLGELLVQAKRRLDEPEAGRLRRSLERVATIVSFDAEAADHYATIRARTDVRGPDALQLACAAAAAAELFVTNDDRLSRKIIPGVSILTSLAAVPI